MERYTKTKQELRQQNKKQTEISKLLEGAKDMISQEDLQALEDIFTKMRASTKRKPKLLRPIVPIEEWLEDPYYLGQDAYLIYPFWKKHIINIFNSPTKINQVILTGALGCLKTNTMYNTTEGIKTLPELIKHTNTANLGALSGANIEKVEVSPKHIIGTKPTKIVTLQNSTIIEGSFDHKVLVYDNETLVWKEFKDLDIGDYVLHSHNVEPFGHLDYSLENAYLIGYFLGLRQKGSYVKNHNYNIIEIELRPNLGNFNYVMSVLDEMFENKPTIVTKASSTKLRAITKKDNEAFDVLADELEDRIIPLHLYDKNKEIIRRVLKGLFDNSSNIDRHRIFLYNESEELIKQVKRLLGSFGINSHIRNTIQQNKVVYQVVIDDLKSLQYFKDRIGYITLHLKDKLDEAIRIHTMLSDNLVPKFNNQKDEAYFNEVDGYFIQVKHIENSYAEVGDIEIPETSYYNIGGLISHNTGKSTIASLIIIRKLYELSCYENISALFNLMGSSTLGMAYLSVNKAQAEITGFAQIRNWIDDIPYFREHFPRNTRVDSTLVWEQERVLLLAGSVPNHFIGTNLFGAILDEANFMEGGSDIGNRLSSKVEIMFNNIKHRATTRFMINGKREHLVILVSSSTGETSFTEQQINISKDDPHTYVVSPAHWDVKTEGLGKERFLVYVGGDGFDPHIIKSIDDINLLLESRKLKPLDRTMQPIDAWELLPASLRDKVLKVPMEYVNDFRVDVSLALRNIAGYSSTMATKFFQSNNEYNKSIKEELIHPFTRDEIVVSTTRNLTQEGFMPIKAYMRPDFKFKDLNKPRYMHLDLSKTGDSTGIAMVHIGDWKTIYETQDEYIRLDGSADIIEETIKVPIVETDFMLRINPPKKPNEISYGKIRDFLLYLKNEVGIEFARVSFDQAFSAQLMQELSELGFPVFYQSVDRTNDAYETMASLIFDGRLSLYDYKPFKEELFDLNRVPNNRGGYKVDHPTKKSSNERENGSKDITDAMAGAIYNVIVDVDKTKVPKNELYQAFKEANKPHISDGVEKVLKDFKDDLLKQLLGK